MLQQWLGASSHITVIFDFLTPPHSYTATPPQTPAQVATVLTHPSINTMENNRYLKCSQVSQIDCMID